MRLQQHLQRHRAGEASSVFLERGGRPCAARCDADVFRDRAQVNGAPRHALHFGAHAAVALLDARAEHLELERFGEAHDGGSQPPVPPWPACPPCPPAACAPAAPPEPPVPPAPLLWSDPPGPATRLATLSV